MKSGFVVDSISTKINSRAYVNLLLRLLAVALLIMPTFVFHRALADEPITASGIESVVLDPGFEPLLQQEPDLYRGGIRQFEQSGHWIVLSVGQAPLANEAGDRQSLSDATKVARAKANANLEEYLHGIRLSGKDVSSLQSTKTNGRSLITQTFSSTTEAVVDSVLAGAQVVGRWQRDQGESLFVMIAIADPQHPWLVNRDRRHREVELRNEQWEPGWRDVFATRPAILDGGVSVAIKDGERFLLCVGKAKRSNDARLDARWKTAAMAGAAKEARQWIAGVSVRSVTTASQQQITQTLDEVTLSDETRTTFETMQSERVAGVIQGLIPVGQWESQDGAVRLAGFVVRCP